MRLCNTYKPISLASLFTVWLAGMAIEVEEKEEAELPELLELIDQLETSADLPGLLLKIGRRLRATPEDRDLLSAMAKRGLKGFGVEDVLMKCHEKRG